MSRLSHVALAVSVTIFGSVAYQSSVSSQMSVASTSDERQGFWVEEVARGLSYPWSMAWLPDGNALILERTGHIRLLRDGKLDPKPLTGSPSVYSNAVDGLLDIKIDPDFATTKLLFISLSEGTQDKRHAAVYSARYTGSGLVDYKLIFRSFDDIGGLGPIASRLLFLADKTLLVAIPDSDAYRRLPQQLDSDVGKIIRINRDGSIPADNPFVHKVGARPEIFSLGHRVPSGLYQDPRTKTIWETDIGDKGGDELNIIRPGANYGWPVVTWGFEYSGNPISNQQNAPGYEDAVHVWTPAVTPSGLVGYSGVRYPGWSGDLFVGNLSGKQLRRLRIADGQVTLEEALLPKLDERIRSPFVSPDGYIYLLTDHSNGRLLRLRPGRPSPAELAQVAKPIAPPPAFDITIDKEGVSSPQFREGDPVHGKQLFVQACSGCHSVTGRVEGGAIGPNLAGVYGRKFGSVPGYQYSPALANARDDWNRLTINLFIADPVHYLPGTKMAAPPVSDPQDRRDIVGFLKASSGK